MWTITHKKIQERVEWLENRVKAYEEIEESLKAYQQDIFKNMGKIDQ